MIFDGRWKWELQKLSWAISVWSKLPILDRYAEHQLNRAVLYSATILRKVIEDETEAERNALRPLPKQEILHATLSAMEYPYIREVDLTMRGKLGTSDYGIGQPVSLDSRMVCNLLVHSYVWSLACSSGKNSYSGFLVASDHNKGKSVWYISFNEWKRLMTLCIRQRTL